MLPPPPAHIHFVGIGGVGLSGIARVLLERGYTISGSDRSASSYTDALARDGATVFIGHDAAHIHDKQPDMVIISSAIRGNPEVDAAHTLGIPVVKRLDMIADIMAGQRVIAVAGSHGKSSTTALIAHVLRESGHDPGYLVGGILKSSGTNAAAGTGDWFVIEADEYDYMFLGLRPDIAVVTNIEWDHPDFFPSAEHFHDAFARFAALLPEDGLLVTCADDAGARRLNATFAEQVETMTYGISHQEASWSADGLVIDETGSTFEVRYYGQGQGRARLTIPGRVNVLNALAAVAVCTRVGVSPTDILFALESFTGVGRRFDVLGEVNGIAVVDDYAHNPSKIRAALQAARGRYPDREIWAVWQPHTFSRTQTFLDKYATAFSAADHVLVTEIYASREQPVAGVTGATTAAAIQHPDARFAPDFEHALDILLREAQSPGAIIVMSAGDANWIGHEFLKRRPAAGDTP